MFSSFKPHFEPKGLNINPYTMAYNCWKDLLTRKSYDRFLRQPRSKWRPVKLTTCQTLTACHFG